MSTSTSSPRPPPPPLAHAIGGSIGSALALLLLYPLERIRTEIQATTNSARADGNDDGDEDDNESWATCDVVEHDATKSSPVPSSSSVPLKSEDFGGKHQPASSSSFVECWKRLHRTNQLYRGVGPVVNTLAISNFVFFYAHYAMKGIILGGSGSTTTTKRKQSPSSFRLWLLLASTLAGMINVLLTNPLWVANLRIVQQRQQQQQQQGDDGKTQSLWLELKRIAQIEGLLALWKGTPTSLLLVSNPVIQFFVYEQIKSWIMSPRHPRHGTAPRRRRRLPRLPQHHMSPLQAFGTGALAKAVATVLTYPLQLTQVLLRLQQQQKQDNDDDDNEEPYKGTWDCLIRLYQEKGIVSWFRGLEAKLLQTVLTSAFTFLTYEQFVGLVMLWTTPLLTTTTNRSSVQRS